MSPGAAAWEGTTTREALPDGSVMLVERHRYNGHRGALVSREVDGEVVWGQVFSGEDVIDGLLADIRAHMAATPDNFEKWWRR